MHIDRQSHSNELLLSNNEITPFFFGPKITTKQALSNLHAIEATFASLRNVTINTFLLIDQNQAVFKRTANPNKSFWNLKNTEVNVKTVTNFLKIIENITAISLNSLSCTEFDPYKDGEEVKIILDDIEKIKEAFNTKFVPVNKPDREFRKELAAPINTFQKNISTLFNNFLTLTREKLIEDLPSEMWMNIFDYTNKDSDNNLRDFINLSFVSKKMMSTVTPALVNLFNSGTTPKGLKIINLLNYFCKFPNIHTLDISPLNLSQNYTTDVRLLELNENHILKCMQACSNISKLVTEGIPFDETTNSFFEISTLKKLKSLKLYYLPQLKQPSLHHETLETLLIHNNQNSRVKLEGMKLPSNLKQIEIIELLYSSAPIITNLTSLQKINISNYRSCDNEFNFTNISNLRLLKTLIINVNVIKIANLQKLNHLENLFLTTDSPLDQCVLYSIFNTSSLMCLGLRNPHITDLSGIEKLTKLEALVLKTPNITKMTDLNALINLSFIGLEHPIIINSRLDANEICMESTVIEKWLDLKCFSAPKVIFNPFECF